MGLTKVDSRFQMSGCLFDMAQDGVRGINLFGAKRGEVVLFVVLSDTLGMRVDIEKLDRIV